MLLIGNCLDKLKELEEGSVQTCVTSPPYWGLRDYDDADQLGQEAHPEEFVRKLTEIFMEVHRVLKDDGTLWLNIGDTYFGAKGGHFDGANSITNYGTGDKYRESRKAPPKHPYLKTKDLSGVPWKLALSLQRKGWYIRQDIIWHKPNPMPESVKDRCTKAHEYIFLLSKSPQYKYNADAIKTAYAEGTKSGGQIGGKKGNSKEGMKAKLTKTQQGFFKIGEGVNRRSVWKIPVKPYAGAHFATFPEKLPELCIKAGSDKGDIVLDTFFGSGTTGWVAQRLSRKWIGIELNPKFAKIANERFKQQQLFY